MSQAGTVGRGLLARIAQGMYRRFAFTSQANMVAAASLVALLGGCLSLWLGQDSNWDLRNYHLYNGYAALQGRLHLDLAPAQMQSYFSPLLDVFQYLLLVRLPGPLVGFVMGVLHGLLFVPVAGVAWWVLRDRAERAWLAPLLGVAGLCMASVLSEFGNTMADNTTALFVVGSLWAVVHAQSRAEGVVPWRSWVVAGVLLGMAVALKLTNAIYAIGMAAALLAAGGRWSQRVLGLTVVAATALLVAALAAGWWYWQLWQHHGNPLLPQFNAWFQSPLAQQGGVADTRWLPRGLGEHVLWPLIFAANPKRVSEISLVQLVWPLLFVVGLALLGQHLLRRRRAHTAAAFAPVLRGVVAFVLVSYLLWQFVFSIHRYLSALELLAPLLLWCGWVRLWPGKRGPRSAGWLVAVCVIVSLVGRGDWGHESWASQAFRVQGPPMAAPAQSVVLLVGAEPQGWRVPLLPAQARYAAVASNFPEAEGYRAALAAMLDERPYQFAMLPGYSDRLALRFEALNRKVAAVGLHAEPGCGKLGWIARTVRGGRLKVEQQQGRCVLVPGKAGPMTPAAAEAEERTAAQARLGAYGLQLVPGSCVTLDSRIGQGRFPYQWCRLQPVR